MPVTDHFVQRAMQRVGCDADAARAWGEDIARSVQFGDSDSLQFVTRVDKKGCRLFRARFTDKRAFYVLVDTEESCCITVLPPGFMVGRQGKAPMKLKEIDL
jgi:hypothetical protein